MNLPKWLWAIIIILLLLGVVGLVGSGFKIFIEYQILENIVNFSLVLTLVAVLFYVYYTYTLAKEAWTPSASFTLIKARPDDPYHFIFLLRNHSKFSLECWCNLNAAVDGQAVSLGGFYSGQSSFDLQPFGISNGHFDIREILAKANCDLQGVKKNTKHNNIKKQLYLNIEFWYNPIGTDKKNHNPLQPHYFDFTNDVLVADF